MAAWYKYRKLNPDKLEVGPTCRQNIKKTPSEKTPIRAKKHASEPKTCRSLM